MEETRGVGNLNTKNDNEPGIPEDLRKKEVYRWSKSRKFVEKKNKAERFLTSLPKLYAKLTGGDEEKNNLKMTRRNFWLDHLPKCKGIDEKSMMIHLLELLNFQYINNIPQMDLMKVLELGMTCEEKARERFLCKKGEDYEGELWTEREPVDSIHRINDLSGMIRWYVYKIVEFNTPVETLKNPIHLNMFTTNENKNNDRGGHRVWDVKKE